MTGRHTLYPARHAGYLTGWVRRLLRPPARILGPYIRAGDTLLDLGCGPGYFSVPMAQMVGDSGMVIAADIQEEMLVLCREAAEREGVASRIRYHRTAAESLALDLPPVLSFTLAFHVLHETADPGAILGEVHRFTRPSGLLLIAEPVGIVGSGEFRGTIGMAVRARFTLVNRPFILLSRAALLQKGPAGV